MNSTPLLNSNNLESCEVQKISKWLTKFASDKLNGQYELAKCYSAEHTEDHVWMVHNIAPACADDDCIVPKPSYTRRVTLNDGKLECNVGTYHWRMSTFDGQRLGSQVLPLSELPRSFADLSFGVSTYGCNESPQGMPFVLFLEVDVRASH